VISSVSHRFLRTLVGEFVVFGTVMSARKSALTLPLPLQFLAAWLAFLLERVLQAQVDYLRAENRLLREKLGAKRLQLTDAERRRLAMLGKALTERGWDHAEDLSAVNQTNEAGVEWASVF